MGIEMLRNSGEKLVSLYIQQQLRHRHTNCQKTVGFANFESKARWIGWPALYLS